MTVEEADVRTNTPLSGENGPRLRKLSEERRKRIGGKMKGLSIFDLEWNHLEAVTHVRLKLQVLDGGLLVTWSSSTSCLLL